VGHRYSHSDFALVVHGTRVHMTWLGNSHVSHELKQPRRKRRPPLARLFSAPKAASAFNLTLVS
jgi:hypothetical protein